MLASRGLLTAMGVSAHLLGPFISACVTPLTIVAVIAVFNWQLGLAALVAAPLVVLTQRWTARLMTANDADHAARDHEASARVIEYLQAQPVLRAGGRGGERFACSTTRCGTWSGPPAGRRSRCCPPWWV